MLVDYVTRYWNLYQKSQGIRHDISKRRDARQTETTAKLKQYRKQQHKRIKKGTRPLRIEATVPVREVRGKVCVCVFVRWVPRTEKETTQHPWENSRRVFLLWEDHPPPFENAPGCSFSPKNKKAPRVVFAEDITAFGFACLICGQPTNVLTTRCDS